MKRQINILNKIDLTYNDDQVYIYKILPKAEINLETAKEMVKIGDSMNVDKWIGNIIDIREMIFISTETRKYFAEQTRSNLAANAIILNNKLHKGLANLYLTFSRPTTPTRLFDNENDAYKWIKEQIALKEQSKK